MAKRKAEEIEKVEGIGEDEVEENGIEVEDSDDDVITALEADEEVEDDTEHIGEGNSTHEEDDAGGGEGE